MRGPTSLSLLRLAGLTAALGFAMAWTGTALAAAPDPSPAAPAPTPDPAPQARVSSPPRQVSSPRPVVTTQPAAPRVVRTAPPPVQRAATPKPKARPKPKPEPVTLVLAERVDQSLPARLAAVADDPRSTLLAGLGLLSLVLGSASFLMLVRLRPEDAR